jgi:hypothetical protein
LESILAFREDKYEKGFEETMKRFGIFAGTALVAVALAACGSSGSVNAQGSRTSGATPSAQAQPSQAATPNTPAVSASAEPATPTASKPVAKVREFADNKNGVPVFKDTNGAAVPDNIPGRIAYGTPVDVDCYADNTSGMTSVNYFYHIVGGTWNNLYAPANTFNNGAEMGPNSVNLDPRVQKCA